MEKVRAGARLVLLLSVFCSLDYVNQALQGQERNRTCSVLSSGTGMPGLGTPSPLTPTVPTQGK